MSTATVARPPAGYTAEDVARAHAQTQEQIRAETIAVILAAYATIDPLDVYTSWFSVLPDIVAALTIGETLMAQEATEYVEMSMAVQGIPLFAGQVNPDAFAATWSDGRATEDALFSVPFSVFDDIEEGADPVEALERGRELLETMVRTEMADTGRDADHVALVGAEPAVEAERPLPPAPPTVEPRRPAAPRTEVVRMTRRERREMLRAMRENKLGWIRMLTLPSCGRCAILAGKWYPWSDGFERHPNCDCRHIPMMEDMAGDVTTSPKAYFDSLSEADQNRYFGKANSEAIRAGADIFQVMNAAVRQGGMWIAGDSKRRYTHEGTTRRGLYGGSELGRRGVERPTPYQIIKDAKGDRTEAIRLLRRFRYII